MIQVKKIKPVGCQVLVTKNYYGWDDFDESGIIIHAKGDLKSYQEVLAVGDDVKFVKPGDTVEINFYKYCVLENDNNSIKVNGSNKVVSLRLNDVTLTNEEDEEVPCFLIDQRDVKYIIEDFTESAQPKNGKKIKVIPPSHKLILPDTSLKV